MDIKKEEDPVEKLDNYEAKYAAYLKAKYFSGEIFEEKVTIDGMTIKASRDAGTRSYADPLAYWNEKFGHIETQTEPATNLSNGKHSSKKSA